MKKTLIIFCLIFWMAANAQEDKNWLQINNKVYINNNMAKFVQGSNYQRGLIEFKTQENCNKKTCIVQGLYDIDCLAGNITNGWIYKYNQQNQLLAKQKIDLKIPISKVEKTVFNYLCTTRRLYMLRLESELKQINYYGY